MPGGDLLRSVYPGILSFTHEHAEEFGRADPEQYLAWLHIAHDLYRQRQRSLAAPGMALAFEGWPYEHNLFADMNFEYPLPPSFTPVMQTQYDMTLNANMWFGIGLWGLAEEYYKAAIRLCTVSNDTVAALQNGANLALCYLAGADWENTLRLCQHLINASIDHLDGPTAATVFQQASTILRWCYIKSGEAYFASQHTAWLLEVAPNLVSLDSSVFEIVREVWEATGDRQAERNWAKEWKDLQGLTKVFEAPDPDQSFEEKWGAPPRNRLELILPTKERPKPRDYLGEMSDPTKQFVLLERRVWGTVGRQVYEYGLSAADTFIASLPPDRPLSAEQVEHIRSVIVHSFRTGTRLFVSVIALNGLDVESRVDLDLDPLLGVLNSDEARCAQILNEYDVSEAITMLGDDMFVSQYYRAEMDSWPFRLPYSVRLEILSSIYRAYILCSLAGVTARGTRGEPADLTVTPDGQSTVDRDGVTEETTRARTEGRTGTGARLGQRSGSVHSQSEHGVDQAAYSMAKGQTEPSDFWYEDEIDAADYYESIGLADSKQKDPAVAADAKHLDDDQRAAVDHRGTNLRIIAGPGSGKTRTLTHRAVALLNEIPPESLMLVTFTKKAAQEIVERMHQSALACSRKALKQAWIGTIHSACWRILHENGHLVGLRPGWSVLDRFDSEQVMRRCARPFGVASQADDVFRLYSYARNSMTDWRDLLGSQRFPKLNNRRGIREAIQSYDRRCRRSNRVDFDDLQVLALRVLQEFPDVRDGYRQRFGAILVDEYQDTSIVQAQLLRLLATSTNTTVVGDDAQAIYGFRAATVENILGFPEEFGATTIKLRTNYRSTSQIVVLASESIKHNQNQVPKQLRSATGSGPLPQVYGGRTRGDEAEFIINRIGELRSGGIQLDDIAVLFRATRLSAQLVAKLRSIQMPYVLVGGEDFFSLDHVKSVLDVVRLLVNPEDTIALSGLQELVGFSTPSALETLEQVAEQSGTSVRQTAQQVAESVPPSERPNYASLLQFYNTIQDLAATRETVPRTVSNIIGYLTPHLRRKPGIEWKEAVEDLDVLVDVATQFTSLTDFVNTLALEQFVSEQKLSATKPLTLSTIHSAKGREWEAVFVIGLVEFWFPLNYAIQQTGTDEEERRLFYVAVTRARKHLYLTHYKRSVDQYGRTHTQDASRFIRELPAAVLATDSTG